MFSDTLNSYFGYVIFLISEQNFFTITDMQNSFFSNIRIFFWIPRIIVSENVNSACHAVQTDLVACINSDSISLYRYNYTFYRVAQKVKPLFIVL